MDNDLSDLADTDEDILNFDVPDDALERVASGTDGKIITWIYSTECVGNCGCPV